MAQAPLDDASLDQWIGQSDAVLASVVPQGQVNAQRGQGAIVKTENGLAYSTPVFDPRTQQIKEVVTPISGDLVSREEKRQMKECSGKLTLQEAKRS